MKLCVQIRDVKFDYDGAEQGFLSRWFDFTALVERALGPAIQTELDSLRMRVTELERKANRTTVVESPAEEKQTEEPTVGQPDPKPVGTGVESPDVA